MVRLAAALLVAATGCCVIATAAGRDASRTLRYRITGEAWDLGASEDCPDGSVRYGIKSVGGRSVGTATLCALTSSKRDGARGDVTVSQSVVETDAFAAGWLRTRSTQVQHVPRDGGSATLSISGTVLGGTRRYARARGTITGSGTRRGDTIDVRVTVALR